MVFDHDQIANAGMDDNFDIGSYFSGSQMAYSNSYGFNREDRACLIRDFG